MLTLTKIYKAIVHGIAFVPLLTTLVLTVFALTLTLNPALQSWNPYLNTGGYFEVHTAETARSILSSVLSGIISITVFGFSMMMVVVNQAASNYSPKVVETLSAQRSNQYILGVYLGSVVFTLIVMMHIDSKNIAGGIPQLPLLVNMLLAIYCILLFVKFIHNISKAVRITNIIENIFKKTKSSIRHSEKVRSNSCTTETGGWTVYCANHSGYFQLVRADSLTRILKKHDCILKVIPKAGTYYTDKSPLFLLSKNVGEDVANDIRATFVTYPGEVISENPMYGFRQLREVAVKALSPGINDPGVAILCVDYLSDLLSMWLRRGPADAVKDSEGNERIILNNFNFSEMFELSLVPIEGYGKRDYTILTALMNAIYILALHDVDNKCKSDLNYFAKRLIEDFDEGSANAMEIEAIVNTIDKLNRLTYFTVPITSRKLMLLRKDTSTNETHGDDRF